MDWHQMLRVLSAVTGSGDSGDVQSQPTPTMPQIPHPSIIMDDPRNGGITGHMPNMDQGNGYSEPIQDNSHNELPLNQGLSPDDVLSGQPSQPHQQDDTMDRILQMFQPEHTASDRLTQMAMHPPVRNKPSKLQILLGLTAAGLREDPALGERTMYKPYYHQLEDYNNQMRPLSVLAGLEHGDNSNERAWALGLLRDRYNDRRADTAAAREHDYQTKILADIENNKNKTKVAERLASVKEYLRDHPDLKPIKDVKTGKWILVNPKTGEETVTPLEHGDTSELDLESAKQRGRMEVQGSRNEAGQERSEAGKWQVVNVGEKSYRLNSATGEMIPIGEAVTRPGTAKPGTGSGKNMSERDKILRYKANADKIKTTNPEFAGFIDIDKNGLPSINAKAKAAVDARKLSPEDYAILQKRLFNITGEDIYGNESSKPATTPTKKLADPLGIR